MTLVEGREHGRRVRFLAEGAKEDSWRRSLVRFGSGCRIRRRANDSLFDHSLAGVRHRLSSSEIRKEGVFIEGRHDVGRRDYIEAAFSPPEPTAEHIPPGAALST
jgi:hypothetical protein